MPARSRTFAAAVAMAMTATLVSVGGSAVASAAAAPAAAPTVEKAAHPRSEHALDLGSDAVVPHRSGRVAKVQKWQVRTLYYYDGLPAKWDWSLRTAVAKWNASGAHIRLAAVAKAKNARVRIGYANIGSAAGMATVGAATNAYVHLSSRFSSMDALNARNRVTIMNVLAHELGHVLGFQHTTARCSLMSPVVDVDACNVVPASQPGYYKCRTLDTALVQRFVKLYGGRARYASAGLCLIDPLPTALSGVTFTGGVSSPVTLHWNRPTSVPSGSTLVIKRWQASSCGTAPSSADTYRPSMNAGVWQDAVTYDDETACFQIQLVNRYGAGAAPQKRLLARWVPSVDAPVIGVPSYDVDAEEFTFSAAVPDGATLMARWDSAHPSICVTSPAGGTSSDFVDIVDGQGTLALTGPLPQCVSFFAYDQETQRYSDPVPVTFGVPAPEVGTATWDAAAPGFHAPATYATGTHLVYLLDANDPSTCPAAYTSGGHAVVEDPDRLGDGVIEFMTDAPDQCVSFYAIDDATGTASAPTHVTVHAPLPTQTPTMGPITVMDKNFYPWFEAQLGGAGVGNKVGYWVLGGSCPQTAPAVTRWRTQLQGDPGIGSPSDPHADYGMFPSVSADVNCVVWTSLDRWGWTGARSNQPTGQDRHGPVLMREFVDEGPEAPTVGTPVWNATTGKVAIPVSQTNDLHVIYDPADPSTCPSPGATGVHAVPFDVVGDHIDVTTPQPDLCVTLYIAATSAGQPVGPVPVSSGTPLQLSARPAPPTVGDVSWSATTGQFSAPMSTPAGSHIVYSGLTPGTPCVTTKPSNAPAITIDTNGVGTFYTLAPKGCVSFWTVYDATGATSRPAEVDIDVPAPSESLTVDDFGLRPRWYPSWTALPSGAAPGDTPAFATIAGPCPDTAPSGIRWDTRTGADYSDNSSTRNYFWLPSQAAGTNCALFTSLSWFGWPHSPPFGHGTVVTDFHGPVVMREFVDNGPVPPTVTEQPSWNSSTGKFRFAVSDDWNLKGVYDPANPATCPSPGASGLQDVDVSTSDGFHITLAPPAPHTCVTLYVAATYGPVRKSTGVPIDLQVPQG